MKMRFLLFGAMVLVGLFAWADPVIESNVDSVQFGQVDVGYPVTRTIRVTGTGLEGNISLAIEGRYANEYSVTPNTITPADAANGVNVRVKYSPKSQWSCWANLVLMSENAVDLVIPITADPQRNGTIFGYNNHRSYSAYVGKTDYSVEVAYFADAEIPPDPNQPMISSFNDGSFDFVVIDDFGLNVNDIYGVSIDGDDCFSAAIVKSSAIVNTCSVRISYNPLTSGSHHAVLNLTCSKAGVPLIVVYLDGEAMLNGDVDGDGLIAIKDVSDLIDNLLNGDGSADSGDVDGDGSVSIRDVSALIDLLLFGN